MVCYLGSSEISKLVIAETGDHNVLRLDVSVNDIFGFAEDQCAADIFAQFGYFLWRKHLIFQFIFQRREQFHTDKNIPANAIFMGNCGEIITAYNVGLPF